MTNLPTWHPANFTRPDNLGYIQTLFKANNSPASYIPDLFEKGWVTINGNHIFINDDGSHGSSHSQESHYGGLAAHKGEVASQMAVGDKNFPLNKDEQDFVGRVGIVTRNNNLKGAVGLTSSAYNGNSPMIEMDMAAIDKAQTDPNATFYHELGHAIDSYQESTQNPNGSLRYAGKMSNSAAFFHAVKDEKTSIVAERISRLPASSAFSPSTLQAIASGKIESAGGKAYLSYVKSNTEMFADSYGQYRTTPARFQQVAPKTYQYMSTVFK